MLTNFSIENIDGTELPYAAIPVQGRPSGVDLSEMTGTVGLVRAERRTHGAALAGALSMLGSIPAGIDCVIFEEYTDDDNYAPAWAQNKQSLDDFMGSYPDIASIYDMSGERPSIVPASTFSLISDDEDRRGPMRLRFAGNLQNLACSGERADMIEEGVLDMARMELVRHILTDRIAVRDDLSRSRAKQIFDCLVIGRVEFPLSEEEVDAAFHASGIPFMDVFQDISFADGQRQAEHDAIRRADELAEAAVILWDWSLCSFGVPFTIAEWKALREKGRRWNLESMCAMAELIGFDMMLDSLLDGVPLSDLVA